MTSSIPLVVSFPRDPLLACICKLESCGGAFPVTLSDLADADDDISDPELQPHATPGGATAGPQGPFPNPFSPVVGSPTAGAVDMSQMVAMMQQMMMTSEAAALFGP